MITHITERETELAAALQAVTAERDAWIAENSPGGWIDNLRKERDALLEDKKFNMISFMAVLESRDALKADADRYRWLRSRVPGGTYRVMGVIYSEGGTGVDAAIDQAMKGTS